MIFIIYFTLMAAFGLFLGPATVFAWWVDVAVLAAGCSFFAARLLGYLTRGDRLS